MSAELISLLGRTASDGKETFAKVWYMPAGGTLSFITDRDLWLRGLSSSSNVNACLSLSAESFATLFAGNSRFLDQVLGVVSGVYADGQAIKMNTLIHKGTTIYITVSTGATGYGYALFAFDAQ